MAELDALQRLEAWKATNLYRTVMIGGGCGHADHAWIVVLDGESLNGAEGLGHGGHRKVVAFERDLAQGSFPQSLRFWEICGHGANRRGLIATIHAALDHWDKLYGPPVAPG